MKRTRNIHVVDYQEVFSFPDAIELNPFFKDAIIPPKDLEIILSAICLGDCLFLSCDKRFIESCLSLGLNHTICFCICHKSSLQDDINKFIDQYKYKVSTYKR